MGFYDLEKLFDFVWFRFAFHVLQVEQLGYSVMDEDVMVTVDAIQPIFERLGTGNGVGKAYVFRTR